MTHTLTRRPIVCIGAKGGGDTLAVFGTPTPIRSHTPASEAIGEPVAVTDTLTVTVTDRLDTLTFTRLHRDGWQVVIDAGTTAPDLPGALQLLVVRNCYLTLRRAVTHPTPVDAAVAVLEPRRALTHTDITAVLAGIPVIELSHDPNIARAIDAGLLSMRRPAALTRALDILITTLTTSGVRR
jgi:hypothetical protein